MIHRNTRGKTGILPVATLFAATASGGFFAGLTADWGSTPPDVAEITASDTLNVRFPPELAAAAPQANATYAFASTDSKLVFFDRNPVYSLPSTSAAGPWSNPLPWRASKQPS